MKLGDAFVALGFDVDDEKLKAFQDKIDTLEISMLKVSGVTAAALYGLDRFIDSITRGAVALRDLHIQTGLSQDSLQQWAMAAHFSDIALPIETAQASIAALQSNLSKLYMGGGNARPFSLLLNADARGMSAIEVLQRLHEQLPGDIQRLGGMPNVISLMQEAGLDPHFVNLLMQTDEQFKKTMDDVKQYMLTNQQVSNLNALGFAAEQLHLKIDILEKSLGAAFAPTLISMMDQVPKILFNIGTALSHLTPLLEGLGVAAVVLSPWLQLGAALFGVSVVLEQIGGYLNGDNNALAKMLENLTEWGNLFNETVIKPIEKLLGMKLDDLKDLTENAASFGANNASNLLTVPQSMQNVMTNKTAHVNTTVNMHVASAKEGAIGMQEIERTRHDLSYYMLNNGGQ